MSSQLNVDVIYPNGGQDSNGGTHVKDPAGFRVLTQFRSDIGQLEQMPLIVREIKGTMSTLGNVSSLDIVQKASDFTTVYFAVGSGQPPRYINAQRTAYENLMLVEQVTRQEGQTANKMLLVTGFNLTDFPNVGDSLRINIDSPTTFQWSLSFAPFTAGIIAPSVPLGPNGMVVYFLDPDNMVPGGYFYRWDRKNAGYSPGQPNFVIYNKTNISSLGGAHFYALNGSIYRLENDYVRSVGYTKVYGRYVVPYQNHLVVGQYSHSDQDAVANVVARQGTPNDQFRVGWSDLNNFDDFLATDVNEADEYFIPQSSVTDRSYLGITGMDRYLDALFIYTPSTITKMVYVGLPNVMQFVQVHEGTGCWYPNSLVTTPSGQYYVGANNFYRFNGVNVEQMGDPIRKDFFNEIASVPDFSFDESAVVTLGNVTGYWHPARREIFWRYFVRTADDISGHKTYMVKDVVYNEELNRWYFREVANYSWIFNSFQAHSPMINNKRYAIHGFGSGGVSTVPTNGLIVDQIDDPLDPLNIVPVTVSAQATFIDRKAIPKIQSNDILFDSGYYGKDVQGVYLDLDFTGNQDANVKVEQNTRHFVSLPVTWVDEGNWVKTNVETMKSFKQAQGRVFRFQLSFGTGDINAWNPIHNALLCGYAPMWYGKGRQIRGNE